MPPLPVAVAMLTLPVLFLSVSFSPTLSLSLSYSLSIMSDSGIYILARMHLVKKQCVCVNDLILCSTGAHVLTANTNNIHVQLMNSPLK